ncbi:hypothetical protein GGR57DRAFT_515368 [Xylariaceae sp. FL1272]|nr:hypothetical protein GGR57DRAFT_515368 [Xylariaceae sp. FL1272]
MAFQQSTERNIIEALPVELCEQIIFDSGLYPEDLRSLRLTCRTFALLTTARLFRVVGVSAAINGGYNLSQIATAHHLAQFVREVVWYETNFDDDQVYRNALTSRDPPISTDQERSNAASIIAGFSLDWFISMITKLPNLRIFRIERNFPELGEQWHFPPPS